MSILQVNQATVGLRQYTLSSSIDTDNVTNNRCPEYALSWSHNDNEPHWPKGHDYFLGNGHDITDNLELRQILSEKLARGSLPTKILFCDLDGVLADFEQGFINKFKKNAFIFIFNLLLFSKLFSHLKINFIFKILDNIITIR
jgi:hypothetical protein